MNRCFHSLIGVMDVFVKKYHLFLSIRPCIFLDEIFTEKNIKLGPKNILLLKSTVAVHKSHWQQFLNGVTILKIN